MSDLTFTVFIFNCQAIFTGASSSANWTCHLNLILSVKIPTVFSTDKLPNISYFDHKHKRCWQHLVLAIIDQCGYAVAFGI